jgi:hypothetical protein
VVAELAVVVLIVVVAEFGVLAVLADLKLGGGGRRARGRGAQLAAVMEGTPRRGG